MILQGWVEEKLKDLTRDSKFSRFPSALIRVYCPSHRFGRRSNSTHQWVFNDWSQDMKKKKRRSILSPAWLNSFTDLQRIEINPFLDGKNHATGQIFHSTQGEGNIIPTVTAQKVPPDLFCWKSTSSPSTRQIAHHFAHNSSVVKPARGFFQLHDIKLWVDVSRDGYRCQPRDKYW